MTDLIELTKMYGVSTAISLVAVVVMWKDNQSTKKEAKLTTIDMFKKIEIMHEKIETVEKNHAKELTEINSKLIDVIDTNTRAINKFDDTAMKWNQSLMDTTKKWNETVTELRSYLEKIYAHNLNNKTKKN